MILSALKISRSVKTAEIPTSGEGGGGTWVIFWVGMCLPGLQIGTPF